MFDVTKLPCLQDHFERAAAAEAELAESGEPEVQYARAPDGPGFQPAARAGATQRNTR